MRWASGRSFVEHLSYTVRDIFGGTSTGQIAITVVGQNDAPVAHDDEGTTTASSPLVLDVLGNDEDVDTGDVLTIGGFDGVSEAGATISIVDGALVYDPGSIFAGLGDGEQALDTFHYTVADGHGGTSSATVNVIVHGDVGEGEGGFSTNVLEDHTTDNLYDSVADLVHEQYGYDAHLVGVSTAGTKGSVTFDPDTHVLTFTADDPRQDTNADTHSFTEFGVLVELASGTVKRFGIGVQVDGYDAFTFSRGTTSANLWDQVLANDFDEDQFDPLTIVSVDGLDDLEGHVSFDAQTHKLNYAATGAFFDALADGETFTELFTYTVKCGLTTDTGEIAITVTDDGFLFG